MNFQQFLEDMKGIMISNEGTTVKVGELVDILLDTKAHLDRMRMFYLVGACINLFTALMLLLLSFHK